MLSCSIPAPDRLYFIMEGCWRDPSSSGEEEGPGKLNSSWKRLGFSRTLFHPIGRHPFNCSASRRMRPALRPVRTFRLSITSTASDHVPGPSYWD